MVEKVNQLHSITKPSIEYGKCNKGQADALESIVLGEARCSSSL